MSILAAGNTIGHSVIDTVIHAFAGGTPAAFRPPHRRTTGSRRAPAVATPPPGTAPPPPGRRRMTVDEMERSRAKALRFHQYIEKHGYFPPGYWQDR